MVVSVPGDCKFYYLVPVRFPLLVIIELTALKIKCHERELIQVIQLLIYIISKVENKCIFLSTLELYFGFDAGTVVHNLYISHSLASCYSGMKILINVKSMYRQALIHNQRHLPYKI